eukprot:SAG31_NODE_23892_length_493_cov_1.000000_1_plen_55_part_00
MQEAENAETQEHALEWMFLVISLGCTGYGIFSIIGRTDAADDSGNQHDEVPDVR